MKGPPLQLYLCSIANRIIIILNIVSFTHLSDRSLIGQENGHVTAPLEIQKQLIEKVTAQRKLVTELKLEAEKKSMQAKADVEAMILGSKSVPKIVLQR